MKARRATPASADSTSIEESICMTLPLPQPPAAARPSMTSCDFGSSPACETSWYQGALDGKIPTSAAAITPLPLEPLPPVPHPVRAASINPKSDAQRMSIFGDGIRDPTLLATDPADGRWGLMVRVRKYRVLDRDYPHALRDLRSPPGSVLVRGELLGGAAGAVVGTREATPDALSFARDLAADLVARGVAVWSGGAIGIDAAAHRGALDAGGISVAVVPTGLD